MNYVSNLKATNFSGQLDEVAALNLASVSGLFASFKFQNVTLHGKTGKKVMTRARYFNTLDKRKFL